MRAGWLGLLLALAGAATAQDIAPMGAPRAGTALRDREFGVVTRQFGLQRKVEMYQWRKDAGRYQRVWDERTIDARAHDQAHANPREMPMQTRYWVATDIQVDGKPLDEDVLKALGEWRDFRPGFSALPGNLSATFQPEGNGLGSAENPLAPEVGDLRVTWRELVLPPLQGRVALADGRWVLAEAAPVPAAAGQVDATTAAPARAADTRKRMLPLGLGVLVVLVAVVVARRRRSRRS